MRSFSALFALVALTASAHAEDPIAVVVGAAAESRTETVAPNLLLRLPLGDPIEIRRSLRGRNARLQSPYHIQEMVPATGLRRQADRQPNVYAFAVWHRTVIAADVLHTRRHHADNGE